MEKIKKKVPATTTHVIRINAQVGTGANKKVLKKGDKVSLTDLQVKNYKLNNLI